MLIASSSLESRWMV